MGCTSSNPGPACFIAILEGRGSVKGEVGMAAIAICLTILRSNLFQPPVDRKVITDRVELEELIDNMSLHHNLKESDIQVP